MKHTCKEHGEIAFCDGCLYDAALAQIERLKDENQKMHRICIELQRTRDIACKHIEICESANEYLKADMHGAEIGHNHFVSKLKERHAAEVAELKAELAQAIQINEIYQKQMLIDSDNIAGLESKIDEILIIFKQCNDNPQFRT